MNASKYFSLGLSMERVLVENWDERSKMRKKLHINPWKFNLFHKGEAKGQKQGKNYLEIHVEVEHNSPTSPWPCERKLNYRTYQHNSKVWFVLFHLNILWSYGLARILPTSNWVIETLAMMNWKLVMSMLMQGFVWNQLLLYNHV